MSKAKYCQLLDELCALAGIKDPKQLYETANLNVDGISVSLMHGGPENEDSMAFFCDFGAPPPELRAKVTQRLLEANVMMMGPGRPSFGMNHVTGNVLLSGIVPMANATGELLMQMLKHYAARAKEWRATYFLLDEERAATVTRPRSNRLLGLGARNIR